MATSSGWNSLSPKQQSDFKAKNFNMKVNVTEAQLNKLRKAGTPTKAISLYKSDPKMREALNRFYGKERVAKAVGSSSTKVTPPKATTPKTVKPTPPTKKGSGSKSTAKKDPRETMGRRYARGPISGQATVEKLIKEGKADPNARKKQDDLAEKILLAASVIPAVRGVRAGVGIVRGVKGIMAAKKVGTVAGKRAKPATVRSTVKDVMGAGKKQTGRRAAPKVTSSGKRVKPTSTPRRAKPTTVRSTVKDIAGIASRKTGARAKPPAAARRAANAESKSMRSRVTGRVVKTRTTGRRAKPRGKS